MSKMEISQKQPILDYGTGAPKVITDRLPASNKFSHEYSLTPTEQFVMNNKVLV